LTAKETEGGKPQLLREEVTEEDIAEVVSSWTHIPVSRLQEGEREKLVKMEERLMRRVIGQHEAIIAVSNAVRRARAGLQDENRPIGSFIFSARPEWEKPSCHAHSRNSSSTMRTP
jgi:ATP-dependent Clp protease ATP-binding subunit ClpB